MIIAVLHPQFTNIVYQNKNLAITSFILTANKTKQKVCINLAMHPYYFGFAKSTCFLIANGRALVDFGF